MPVKKEMAKDAEGSLNINGDDLKSYYHINKPMILRQVGFLNLLIESGGLLFFIIFSILFLIVAYSAKHSVFWTLLCIPGLFFLYFVLNMVSALLSRIMVK
jgi:hypothetical protein